MIASNADNMAACTKTFKLPRQIACQPAGLPSGKYAGLLVRNTSCQQSFFRATFDPVNIVFANTKGGVGKSTLAVHLAVWLHDQGTKVALLDTDKQRSSSHWIGEAEPLVTVRTAATPEECLLRASKLSQKSRFCRG